MTRGARRREEIAAGRAAYAERRDAERVCLRLPTPTGVNDLHTPDPKVGMRRSKAYEAWIDAAGWAIKLQRPGRIVGRYTLDLALPRERNYDLDACIKAASDLLQLHGIIRNDRDAERIGLWWQDISAETLALVRPAGGVIAMPGIAEAFAA